MAKNNEISKDLNSQIDIEDFNSLVFNELLNVTSPHIRSVLYEIYTNNKEKFISNKFSISAIILLFSSIDEYLSVIRDKNLLYQYKNRKVEKEMVDIEKDIKGRQAALDFAIEQINKGYKEWKDQKRSIEHELWLLKEQLITVKVNRELKNFSLSPHGKIYQLTESMVENKHKKMLNIMEKFGLSISFENNGAMVRENLNLKGLFK